MSTYVRPACNYWLDSHANCPAALLVTVACACPCHGAINPDGFL